MLQRKSNIHYKANERSFYLYFGKTYLTNERFYIYVFSDNFYQNLLDAWYFLVQYGSAKIDNQKAGTDRDHLRSRAGQGNRAGYPTIFYPVNIDLKAKTFLFFKFYFSSRSFVLLIS